MDVIAQATDSGQLSVMADQLKRRYGQRPEEWLADGGYSTLEDLAAMERQGTRVYAPVKEEEKKRARGEDPFALRKGDSPEIIVWRQRMGTAQGQAIYRERGSIAEYVNGVFRNRNLQQFLVRGLKKVKAVALWQALAYNLTRIQALQASRQVLRPTG